MVFSQRLKRLGSETAFLVSAEAAEVAAKGKKVYPFHLGDINLASPAHIRRAASRALEAGYTGYCPPAGIAPLREALAANVSAARNLSYTAENVSIQPGGKPTIGKFIQIAMERGDEVLYPNPGYPIYESQINYYGGQAKPYRYIADGQNFAIDIDHLRSQISNKTSCLIYNNYQNPLGASSSEAEMTAIAALANEYNLTVLSDEAYFEILYQGKGKSIASLPGMQERTVILYTFSKKFSMTGWRLGGCIGPQDFIRYVNQLNVNAESCTCHFVQHAGVEALERENSEVDHILSTLQERRDLAVELLNLIPGVTCNKPKATFYLFPDVTEIVEQLGLKDVEEFRSQLLRETGVSFCTRHHFGTALADEKRHYIRFAYSGIDKKDIDEGLKLMKEYLFYAAEKITS